MLRSLYWYDCSVTPPTKDQSEKKKEKEKKLFRNIHHNDHSFSDGGESVCVPPGTRRQTKRPSGIPTKLARKTFQPANTQTPPTKTLSTSARALTRGTRSARCVIPSQRNDALPFPFARSRSSRRRCRVRERGHVGKEALLSPERDAAREGRREATTLARSLYSPPLLLSGRPVQTLLRYFWRFFFCALVAVLAFGHRSSRLLLCGPLHLCLLPEPRSFQMRKGQRSDTSTPSLSAKGTSSFFSFSLAPPYGV